MPLTVFLAFCILGFDFLLYVLFQWVYGEKYREHARRVAAREKRRRVAAREKRRRVAAREKRRALSAKQATIPHYLNHL